MARRKIVAGNWKMNMTPSQAVELCNTLKDLVKSDDVDVVYCVPAIDIVPVVEAVKGTNVEVGAENMYFEEKGAYTGEISADMLLDAGVKYVIIGHSERRDYFKECDCLLNKKVKKALEKGLIPILCCGETLEQREMGVTMDWIRLQIKSDLADVTADQVKGMVIAYEPIWAIGTGKTATTEQAEEVCKGIRECIAEMYDTDTAEAVRIQYGGSVNAGNAAELFAQPDIDGGLVGGASLKADFWQDRKLQIRSDFVQRQGWRFGNICRASALFYRMKTSFPYDKKRSARMRTRRKGRWLPKQPRLGARMCQGTFFFTV